MCLRWNKDKKKCYIEVISRAIEGIAYNSITQRNNNEKREVRRWPGFWQKQTTCDQICMPGVAERNTPVPAQENSREQTRPWCRRAPAEARWDIRQLPEAYRRLTCSMRGSIPRPRLQYFGWKVAPVRVRTGNTKYSELLFCDYELSPWIW